MAIFFSKAALLTFGGAYAVLPYVYQGAVETFAWLTPEQMIDGLALGESTPGPLIMIVAFVGFVGAWTKAVFGPAALVLAGIAGASVATFFTFLPSFFFILAGGPLVETTHGQLRFTAPLTGITAAVVGVIVNLAVFFAWHVFWPRGIASGWIGGLDWTALAIGIAAAVALFRFKANVILVILACGMAGYVARTMLAGVIAPRFGGESLQLRQAGPALGPALQRLLDFRQRRFRDAGFGGEARDQHVFGDVEARADNATAGHEPAGWLRRGQKQQRPRRRHVVLGDEPFPQPRFGLRVARQADCGEPRAVHQDPPPDPALRIVVTSGRRTIDAEQRVDAREQRRIGRRCSGGPKQHTGLVPADQRDARVGKALVQPAQRGAQRERIAAGARNRKRKAAMEAPLSSPVSLRASTPAGTTPGISPLW
jgi:chromate transport protein ChrA